MARGFDAAKVNREMRAAQRKAEAELKREVDRVNRENQRRVDAYNREVDRVNRENQRRLDAYNRKVDQHNQKVLADYNRQVGRVNAQNRAVIGRSQSPAESRALWATVYRK